MEGLTKDDDEIEELAVTAWVRDDTLVTTIDGRQTIFKESHSSELRIGLDLFAWQEESICAVGRGLRVKVGADDG